MSENRVQVPDPSVMRRAGKRVVVATIAILILATLLTIWGITLLAAGELPGLPLAVGGAALGIGAVVLASATLRVRRTLDHDTVSRDAMLAARWVVGLVRTGLLLTLLLLVVFGLVRVLAGEWWSLMVALLMGAVLYLLAKGASNIVKAQDQSLSDIGRRE
jgi:hypothetical protein